MAQVCQVVVGVLEHLRELLAVGAAAGVLPPGFGEIHVGIEPGAVVGTCVMHDLWRTTGLCVCAAHLWGRAGNDVAAAQPLPVEQGVPCHIKSHEVAACKVVENVLVEPLPMAHGGQGDAFARGGAAAKLRQVEHKHACLEVGVRVLEAHVVLEIVVNGLVVAACHAGGVGIECGSKEIAFEVHVVELGDVVEHHEVAVDVGRLVHAWQKLGGKQAVIRLAGKVAMAGERGVSCGGHGIEEAHAYVGLA